MLDQVVAAEPADRDTPRDELKNRESSPAATVELSERRVAPQSADARGAAGAISEASGWIVVTSRGSSIRWRVLPPGRVERSAHGGTTWTLQLSDAGGGAISGGSAPSASDCWIVGQGGTILRTVDAGETWQRVTPPRPADLIGIEALDAR